MKKISQKALIHTGLRLTLLQSAWCEGGMQSVGLAYCLLPSLRGLKTSSEHLRALLSQYREPFNTHPFLVGAVVGATLRLVEDGKENQEITAFLRGTMGPLAALGDPFLRNALPIFVATTSSLVTLSGGILAGIITLLILFNTVHISVRFGGFYIGYRKGYHVLNWIGERLNHTRTNVLRILAALGAGVVPVAAAIRFGPADNWWVVALIGAVGLLGGWIIQKYRPTHTLFIPIALLICVAIEVSL
ncbi:MAG: PTS system mannose/fructose/sorbose family transporter subunit IID [Myxococcota bacterium]|nr:PTS system mannose/fructose/sorbose family transporter subunit IID [Myxococcota bacterium]